MGKVPRPPSCSQRRPRPPAPRTSPTSKTRPGSGSPARCRHPKANAGSPFDNCGATEFWDPYLAYNQTYYGSYTEEGFTKYLFGGGVGAVGFLASDPLFGSASVSCNTPGAEWEEANGYTPIETSSAAASAKQPKATHLRFVGSLARIVGGEAQVEVQAFGARRAEVRAEVRLTTKAGKPLGQGKAWTWVGAKLRIVSVPLRLPDYTDFNPKPLELRVRAVLLHADGSAGSGDTTRRLLLR